jgi:hypothetical protein
MRSLLTKTQFDITSIPESWNNVEDFYDWWVQSGCPFLFPKNVEVFKSDDATAVCIFRKGQFQIELYLIHAQPKVPIHEHPNVEVIKVRASEDSLEPSPVLYNGQSHGAGMRLEAADIGFPLFAVQHWKKNLTPTTVAAQWKGKTVGPLQEELIRRFHPNALVLDGYADVTKTMDYLEELKNAKSA